MPFVEGNTLTGWGVYRDAPWAFAGIFANREQAEQKAKEMGDDYKVGYGDNQEGTDNFMMTGKTPR